MRRAERRCVGFDVSSACPRLGFELRLAPGDSLSPADRLALRAAFSDMLRMRGLASEGSASDEWAQRIWREGSQAEHADREAVTRWADDRGDVRVEAGPIVDLDEC